MLSCLCITVDDIQQAIRKLNNNKGSGSDGIPPLFYSACIDVLVLPLHLLFNHLLSRGQFPSEWKHAYVVPVYKSDSTDYHRPASILQTISKLFESIVFSKLSPPAWILQETLTITNLFSFVEFSLKWMGDGLKVHCVYTDFSKAFDKVNHSIPIQKLSMCGIAGSLLDGLCSYLSERKHSLFM